MTTLGFQVAPTGRKQSRSDYETDFFRWTERQAQLLRDARFSELDILNLSDEIESLGRAVKREIESRLKILVVHLLMWRCQPERRGRSWRGTIVEQRRQINRELGENPSLGSYPEIILHEDYDVMRLRASGETELSEETFPADCPFTIGEVLDPNFYPEAE